MTNSLKNNQSEKTRLLEERDKLRQKIISIEADYRSGLASDSEDRAIELENADVLEGIAKAASEELARIEDRLRELGQD